MKMTAKQLLTALGAIALAAVAVLLPVDSGYSQQSRFEGKIVERVEFIGVRDLGDGNEEYIELKNTDDASLYDACITEEGYPFHAAEITEDIKNIFKEGNLANVKVEVQESGEGVIVRFYCEERPIVSEIEYRGLDKIRDSDFSQSLAIRRNDPYRKMMVERSVEIIRKTCLEKGLLNPIVRYRVVQDKESSENAVKIIFIVDEGEEISLVKLSILGTDKVNDYEIKGLLEINEENLFSNGEFNRDLYEKEKQKIIAFYRHQGYLDAEIIEELFTYEWADPEAVGEEVTPEMLEDPEMRGVRTMNITIKVVEGERYFFDGYTLQGNDLIKSSHFFKKFSLRKKPASKIVRYSDKLLSWMGFKQDNDVVFDDMLFQQDRQMINMEYSSMGYIFARVIPQKTVEEREVEIDGKKVQRKYVKFDLRVAEGKQAYIENIIIKGNKKTLDKVIRREIIVQEGELFNSYKMQISRERIYALGFFKEVNIDIRPGSKDDQMNLIIDVVEQPTGTISVGGGYGTNTGLSIFADLGETNLGGRGQSVNLRFEYGPERASVSLSFREPWMFDYPIAFSSSVFYNLYTIETTSIFTDSDETAEYRKHSFGYSLGLSYRFWYWWSIGANWGHSFKSVLDASGNSTDAVLLEQALGYQEKRSTTFYLLRNTVDHPLNPTKGFKAQIGMTLVGGYVLRGDDHYVKYNPELYAYYTPFHLPLLKSHPVVFELRADGQFLNPPFQRGKVEEMQSRTSNEWLETEDRLVVGGPETLRGWDYYDLDLPDSWRMRLFHRIMYGAEVRIPVHPQYLWLVGFFDAAALFSDKFWEQGYSDSDMETINLDKKNQQLYDIRDIGDVDLMNYFRYSYGFGFKIQIPMMPLRFWWGRKVIWAGEENGYFKPISDYNFQFSIGDYRY